MITLADSVSLIHKLYQGPIPKTALLLGSGWGEVVKHAQIICTIPYRQVFGHSTSVPGHEGNLLIATLNQMPVIFLVGRLHMYEGYTAKEATFPIRLLNELGVKTLILTSASGAINEHYQVGDLVVIEDMITLFISLLGPLAGPSFVDLSDAYDLSLRNIAKNVLSNLNYPFHEGIHLFLKGPHYETPADKMACKILGADTVGMSIIPETIQARALHMQVLGLTLITNLAFVKHNHEEVLSAAISRSDRLATILRQIVTQIG